MDSVVVCSGASACLTAAAMRVLVKDWRQYIWATISYLCAAIGIALWPTATAIRFDRSIGIAGLAHILTDSAIPLTFLLQYRLALVLRSAWLSVAQRLFVIGLGLIVVHATLWAAANATLPGDHALLWYNHYYGQPVQLLVTYLVLAASIVYSASCCISGYRPSLKPDLPLGERLTSASIVVIATGAGVYGLLVAGQVTASATGHGSATVVRYTVPLMSGCAAVAGVVVCSVLFGQRLLEALPPRERDRQMLERIRKEANRLDRIHANIVNLSIGLEERLLRVHQDYSAASAVETVTRMCRERGISPERRKVAREAVRILTLSFDNVAEAPFYDEDELAERKGMAEYYLVQADGSFFFDDVYKVCFLAVGGAELLSKEEMPEEIEFEHWHYELADIVRTALKDYKRKA
jgi:hypothetical protein